MPNATTYQKGRTRFTYRVAAVIQDQTAGYDRLLLHHSARDAFWSLPGGKVDLGEEAEQALRREMREALGSEIQIERLLWLVENFFEEGGQRHHELGMYFLARLPEDDPHLREDAFESVETHDQADSPPLTFQWFSYLPEALAGVDLRPAFLREGLAQIPNQITNIKIIPAKS